MQLYLSWLESLAVCTNLQETIVKSMAEADEANQERIDRGELTAIERDAAELFSEESKRLAKAARHWMHEAKMQAVTLVAKVGNMVPVIITRNPEAYQGYRLEADLLRVTGQFGDDYDRALEKVESINPNSNGLQRLRSCLN